MLLDLTSLLIALGFSGAAIGVTLLMAWFSARSERFMLHLGISVALMVAGVVIFANYGDWYSATSHFLAFAFVIGGFASAWNSATCFRTAAVRPLRTLLAGAVTIGVIAIPFGFGWDGLGAVFGNIACGCFLGLIAHEFWRARGEAPIQIMTMIGLYALTALSFFACAITLAFEGNLVLSGVPSNLAEEINAFTCIFALTGIGALSLALNQSRLARRHRTDAMTDPLTGLLNRRALFERFGEGLVAPSAVLVCDLDHFKVINDRHGHAAGDDVLRQFAAIVRKCLCQSDVAARLGGEEFAIVLPGASAGQAQQVAERIRAEFAGARLETLAGPLESTVSVGVAIATGASEAFEPLLGRADAALYAAKDAGRNRVVFQTLQLVA